MANNITPLHTKDGALFVQTEKYTQPQYVGCVDIDTLDEPGGGIDTLIRCFNVNGQGWDVISSTLTPPDPVTTTITELVYKRQSVLESLKNCPATFYFHYRDCGRADQFNNYVRTAVIGKAYVGDRGREGLAMREEDTVATRTYSLSGFPPVHDLFKMQAVRVGVAETGAFNDIAFTNDVRCASSCGPAQGPCKVGFAVADPLAGSAGATANVYYTTNYGETWTATSTDPFGGGEAIASVVVVQIDNNTYRVIVARGTTDAGAPAEIAYSDDYGTTWTSVSVGSTNGQFAQGPGALFAIDLYNIWLVVNDGYIYKSSDGGATWATQEAGVVTSEDLHSVHFIDQYIGYAVGTSDAILKTVDGGQTWSATGDDTGTGDDILTVFATDNLTVFVGTDGGDLFRTGDGGATWDIVTFSGSGSGAVTDVVFFNDLIGFALHNTAAPAGRILRTIDGGFSWEIFTNGAAPANSGLNALAVCDENNAWAVGEPNGGTGVLLKALPVG